MDPGCYWSGRRIRAARLHCCHHHRWTNPVFAADTARSTRCVLIPNGNQGHSLERMEKQPVRAHEECRYSIGKRLSLEMPRERTGAPELRETENAVKPQSARCFLPARLRNNLFRCGIHASSACPKCSHSEMRFCS